MFRSRRPRRAHAPKLAIRTEWPLSWRIGALLTLLSVVIMAVAIAYDQGRRRGGYLHEESQQQLVVLRQQLDEARAELDGTRKIADSSTSRLQVEQTAQERLAGMIRNLEEENGRLKAELAVFEGLASNQAAKPALAVSRVDVQPEGSPGRFRYRLMIARTAADRAQEFKGQLQIEVSLQRGDQAVKIILPENQADANYQLAFRYFKRLEGYIQLSPTDRVGSMDFRIVEDGKVRASQTFRPST